MSRRAWALADPRRDHYLSVPGARMLDTGAVVTATRNFADTIATRTMMCLYGEAGVGKTVAVNACVRGLAVQRTLWVQVRCDPHPRTLRAALVAELGLTAPNNPRATDQILKHALQQHPWVLVCDEAQWLSPLCLEWLRHLWDDPSTDIAVVFVGGPVCHRLLSSTPQLATRIGTWQHMRPLTPAEVVSLLPRYHRVWECADPDDLLFVDSRAQGNLRAWAKVTVHVTRALTARDQREVDRRILTSVFTKLGWPV